MARVSPDPTAPAAFSGLSTWPNPHQPETSGRAAHQRLNCHRGSLLNAAGTVARRLARAFGMNPVALNMNEGRMVRSAAPLACADASVSALRLPILLGDCQQWVGLKRSRTGSRRRRADIQDERHRSCRMTHEVPAICRRLWLAAIRQSCIATAILSAPIIERIATHLGLQPCEPPRTPTRAQALQHSRASFDALQRVLWDQSATRNSSAINSATVCRRRISRARPASTSTSGISGRLL